MTAFEPTAAPTPEQLDYILRRAQQESIAAVRSIDPRGAEPHARMASAFSARALMRMASAFSARALMLLGDAPDEQSG